MISIPSYERWTAESDISPLTAYVAVLQWAIKNNAPDDGTLERSAQQLYRRALK